MAIAHVQSKNANGDAPSVAISFNATPTVGNLIVVAVANFGADIGTGAVTDNQGNTYTRRAHASNTTSGDRCAIFDCPNVASSGTFTITATVGTPTCGGCITVAIHEYSGAAVSAFDNATQNTGNSTTPSSGNITPTLNNSLIFGVEVDANGDGTTITAGTNFTIRQTQLTSSTQERIGTEDRILATAAAVAATFTLGASAQWGCCVASYKPFVAATDTSKMFLMF